uniref:Uncharacterized protein n=1 Tax=viral metagenome TaxID=1070528 RepID=A0A6C0C9U5_9ZZZZ
MLNMSSEELHTMIDEDIKTNKCNCIGNFLAGNIERANIVAFNSLAGNIE